MISRSTTRLIAEIFAASFRRYGSSGTPNSSYYESKPDEIYDFLYDKAYPAWFCNLARKTGSYSYHTTRPIQDFIMQLHTGESVASVTATWSWQQRERLGQELLQELAEDLTVLWKGRERGYSDKGIDEQVAKLHDALSLDGFEFRGNKLLAPETDALDIREEMGVIETLYTTLELAGRDTAFHHLKLSEEHYFAKKWDDSISNSRKFLECVLGQAAAKYSSAKDGRTLGVDVLDKPVRVREYLEKATLLETKEKEAIASVYGLLSHTGGHPYMAEGEQARLLRHLALTLSQFILLRLQGALRGKAA